jgi:hypothetical protein
MRIHEDPDPNPGQALESPKVEILHLKYTLCK